MPLKKSRLTGEYLVLGFIWAAYGNILGQVLIQYVLPIFAQT